MPHFRARRLSIYRLFFPRIGAEVEARADRITEGPAPIRKDVVEWVVVDDVDLRANAEVPAQADFAPTPNAVEAGPVGLRQLHQSAVSPGAGFASRPVHRRHRYGERHSG